MYIINVLLQATLLIKSLFLNTNRYFAFRRYSSSAFSSLHMKTHGNTVSREWFLNWKFNTRLPGPFLSVFTSLSCWDHRGSCVCVVLYKHHASFRHFTSFLLRPCIHTHGCDLAPMLCLRKLTSDAFGGKKKAFQCFGGTTFSSCSALNPFRGSLNAPLRKTKALMCDDPAAAAKLLLRFFAD